MVKQKKLLLRCADDSVMVMALVLDDGHGISRAGTAEEIEQEIAKSSPMWPPDRLPIIGWEEITADDLPERPFRNAWTNKGGKKIDHDMNKVRAMHLTNLRAARDRVLADLDGPWMRATGQGDKVEAKKIEDKRQALRDLPDTVSPILDQCQTWEEVYAVRPTELDGETW